MLFINIISFSSISTGRENFSEKRLVQAITGESTTAVIKSRNVEIQHVSTEIKHIYDFSFKN